MDVKLPRLGEGADSGVVVSVLVKEGDVVEEGQTLVELENEKAVAPIPATASGTVSRIRVKEGDKISVGQVILTIEAGGAEAKSPKEEVPESATRPAKDKLAPAAEQTGSEDEAENEEEESGEAPAKSEAEVAAAPSIRKLARELGIDLTRLRGSERGGRIVLTDLRAYIQRLQKQASQPKTSPTAPIKSKPTLAESIDFSKWGSVSRKPMSQLRKIISQRMSENWNTIPHVTQFDEADVTALMELRKKHAPAYEAKGARLTLTSFVLKAVVAALKKHSIFNASLDEATEEIVFKDYYHIGIAVDTEAGLIVPVIRDVDKKDLVQLSKELQELAIKARERKVSMDELKGGTFTISNQGGIGGGHFTPIVNKPEVAILGLGRSVLKPVVKNAKIEPRMMLPVAISYDHRLIDGGAAARFAVELVQELETFKEEAVRF